MISGSGPIAPLARRYAERPCPVSPRRESGVAEPVARRLEQMGVRTCGFESSVVDLVRRHPFAGPGESPTSAECFPRPARTYTPPAIRNPPILHLLAPFPLPAP